MRRIVLGSLLLLLGISSASATIVEQLDLRALVERSDRIVRGRVLRQQALWDAAHERIFTDVTVAVDDAYKGEKLETVVVRRLGGVMGALGMTTIGEAEFRDGEEVFLFLRRVRMKAGDDRFVPIGMAQGKLHIARDARKGPLVRFDSQGATLMSRDASGRTELIRAESTERPLSDLEREVRSLLGSAR